jgi:glycosyltransferase involved in cell wall biosynthesis
MKILHFYKAGYPDSYGGIESFIDQLASSLIPMGVETKVLALSKNKKNELHIINGYSIHYAHANFEIASVSFSFQSIFMMKRLSNKCDIVHYHFPWPFMDLVHFLLRIKKPTLVTYHSDIIRQKKLYFLYKPLMNKFLESVNLIVATSENYLHTSDVLSRLRPKVKIIPIGLNEAKYKYLHIVPSFSRFEFDEPFFLFIGALRYYKGLEILLEALKYKEYTTVIAGSGLMEKRLKAQAKLLGLNKIVFVGSISEYEKSQLLKSCFCVTFPSHLRAEAFGISLLEGAMFGKPLISCEIGTGTSFININNHTGLVIPPSDPLALHNAMKFMIENQSKAKEMGLNAECRFRQLFTADKMAQSYYDLYSQLLDGGNAH